MFTRLLYAQILKNRIRVRNTARGLWFEAEASPAFSHPRMLVGDFSVAQDCLKRSLRAARGTGWVFWTTVLVHPMEVIEGGLTQIEERMFHELALSAGASQVALHTGLPLDDQEILAFLKRR